MILAVPVSHAVARGQEEHELLSLIAEDNCLSDRSDRNRINIEDLIRALSRPDAESVFLSS